MKDEHYGKLVQLDARLRRTAASKQMLSAASMTSSTTAAPPTDTCLAMLPSRVLADRLEAIVSMALLLQEHDTDPVFVNSAFLKLTEAFRGSANMRIRECVVYAVESLLPVTALQAHITNADQLLGNIQHVLLSRHAADRVLALRLLMCFRELLRDRLDLHFYIRECFFDDRASFEEQNTALQLMAELCEMGAVPFLKFIYEDMLDLVDNMHLPKWQWLDVDLLLKILQILCQHRPVHQALAARLQAKRERAETASPVMELLQSLVPEEEKETT